MRRIKDEEKRVERVLGKRKITEENSPVSVISREKKSCTRRLEEAS